MKLFKKFGKRVLLGAMICGCSMFNSTSAAPAQPINDMAAFREAITAPTKPDNRVFHEDIYFFVPEGHAQLDILGQIQKNSLNLAGTLEFMNTDEKGDKIDLKIPFYVTQNKKNMLIYFNMGDGWRKFQAPSLSAMAIDSVVTPDNQDIEDEIALVKDVKVLRETDTRRTMLVNFDGDKLADLIAKSYKENPADKGTKDDAEFQETIMKYLDKGIRRANTWYMWTVDKKDWQTLTQSTHLSAIIQETARAALEDENAKFDPIVESLLETVAYYSDFKEFTTFLNPDVKHKLELPKEAKQAIEVDDVIPD